MSVDSSAEILKVDFECPSCQKLKQQAAHISVPRVIEKLDRFLDKNDLASAAGLLVYWQAEAKTLGDLSGELSVVNEMLGLYRKMQNKEKAEKAIQRALELLSLTGQEQSISGAVILINVATTMKAFGAPQKAVPLYEQAADVYEKEGLLPTDSRYAAFYNNFGTTLVELKQFERAKELYVKAIALTGDNPERYADCAITYLNLANLYDDWQGHLCEEIPVCLQKAEALLRDERIKQNSYYAFVCEKCAPSFDYFGYFILAKELSNKARELYDRA